MFLEINPLQSTGYAEGHMCPTVTSERRVEHCQIARGVVQKDLVETILGITERKFLGTC